MKKIFFIFSFLLFALICNAQIADVAWGEEIKIRRSSADQMQVFADENAVFFADRHDPFFPYFVYGPIKNETATLIKLDKNLTELYKTDFRKELKEKEFEDFFFLQKKIFLFASFYNYKTLSVSLLSVEINKADGKLVGDWKEIISWKKYEDFKEFGLKAEYNVDSSQIIIVASIGNKKKNKYEVTVVDAEMKVLAKAAIENEFDARIFELEQLVYTRKGCFLLLGRLGDKAAEKTTEKKIQFQHSSLRMYSSDGSMEKEIKMDDEYMWVFSAKISQVPGRDVVLAALYSNNKADDTIDGMLVEQLDPLTGEIKSSNKAEIDPALLSTDEDIKNNFRAFIGKDFREKVRERRSRENGFLKFARFNNFIFTHDNRVLIFAEKYKFYEYTVSKGPGIGLNASWSSSAPYTVSVFELGDLIIGELGADGTIARITTVQKKQEEILHKPLEGFNTGLHLNLGYSYFDSNCNFPFFSGFSYSYSPETSKVSVLFNDHPDNGNSRHNGQKLKAVSSFENSDCYLLQLDTTGKFTSDRVFTNNDRPTAMLRSGYFYGEHFYFLGKADRGQFARPVLQPARITFR